jgi:hypothetical protein
VSLRPAGWLAAVGAALLGVAVATLAMLTHRNAARVADVLVPWGLALAVLASVLPSLALASLRAGRVVVGAYGAGWCLVMLVLVDGRGEGDYLVAADVRGWGFLVVASLAVVAVTLHGLATVDHTRGAARAEPDDLRRRR